MTLNELHASLLSKAFDHVLGSPEMGSMAYVRCLTSDIVETLAKTMNFSPKDWIVWRVADVVDDAARTITADRAVEMRETKGEPILLLVDTASAGAGMDGIFSAAREVQEGSIFAEAIRLAGRELTKVLSSQARRFAEQAVKKARRKARRAGVSPWAEFDFFVRSAAEKKHPGAFLHLIGLWPMKHDDNSDDLDGLEVSALFVNRLMGTASTVLTPAARIGTLRLLDPTDEQIQDLEDFLLKVSTRPLLLALASLAENADLWVNNLRIEPPTIKIQDIELTSWRTRTGQISKWSGLIEEGDPESPPTFILRPDAQKMGQYSKLEIRWKTRPENLEKNAAQYKIAIVTDMEEEISSQEVSHSGKREQTCRFTDDDFSSLGDDALIPARIVVSVIGNQNIEDKYSEEFRIRFGEPPEAVKGGVGKKVRTFSEGLVELSDRTSVSMNIAHEVPLPEDSKGFVILRTIEKGKTFRVFRPSLIRDVEQRWLEENGAIGRWRVKVRSSGTRAGILEFVPFMKPDSWSNTLLEAIWARVENASRRIVERFANGSGVGQIYDESAKGFDIVKEYLLAWAALMESADRYPLLGLVNTVEVQSLSDRTIGLIVLPSHPLRVAWHVAYDNLALHSRFEQKLTPKEIREELKVLDGAMFPAFLPGLTSDSTFVFADTLGFHAVGMVLDQDKEPKAAIALVARALGETETADSSPTVGRQSSEILGKEIIKYLECHGASRLLHIHALRPGDGLTVARALGHVHKYFSKNDGEEGEEENTEVSPAFVLELYPSEHQRGIAGRFIAEVCEKRRSGAGVLSEEDLWMLRSHPLDGGLNLPGLRWARREEQNPQKAAHLAAAFDTFDSRVSTCNEAILQTKRPILAFGLLSFFERSYQSSPAPIWLSLLPQSLEGEKHPSDRTHTERLLRIQQLLLRLVAANLSDSSSDIPILRTEVSAEKAENLRTLHALCDWVITLDRNAGIEYFDSPRDDKEIYDAYVIDCVPEREDLGCLQLITSTSNLEEVRSLLDHALDQMGLSRSRRNAEFLLENLKALSGRLAIRLTGNKTVTSELVALAIFYAHCRLSTDISDSWVSLSKGFFVPIDDVRDILPQLGEDEERGTRPDLIHISMGGRKGLLFRFVEVKYRRHLRAARNPRELNHLQEQVNSLRRRWDAWYLDEALPSTVRAIRRAKLARILRFYADKAHRHYLNDPDYRDLTSEIDRMISAGGSYVFGQMTRGDRGFIFCPEYGGTEALEISPGDWETRVFLFGPNLLPDSEFRNPAVLTSTISARENLLVRQYSKAEEEKTLLENYDHEDIQNLPELTLTSEGVSEMESIQSVKLTDLLNITLGVDVLTNTPVNWTPTINGNPHLMVVGLPGMGKTTCLLNICKQMLGGGMKPIIFSYHQDIDERLESSVGNVRFIDFHGLGFNPLHVLDRISGHGYLDVAGSLRDIFAAIFPELGDVQGERIRHAIKDSFTEMGWGSPDINPNSLKEPDFKRFLEILRDYPRPDRGHQTLLARLEELADYGFFDLSDQRESLWDNEFPVVVRVHTTQNDNLQKAFASLIFYGLYKDMFRRGIQNRLTHSLVFDEAHRAANLKLIPTMAKECRKYGISLILASQEARDFHASLYSAIANYLVLRLTDVDAKALVRNVASSDQERALVDRIKQMDRFKALYFCEGKKRHSYLSLSS
jgi:DNA phosphorothioation-dependent restriction protein DptH